MVGDVGEVRKDLVCRGPTPVHARSDAQEQGQERSDCSRPGGKRCQLPMDLLELGSAAGEGWVESLQRGGRPSIQMMDEPETIERERVREHGLGRHGLTVSPASCGHQPEVCHERHDIRGPVRPWETVDGRGQVIEPAPAVGWDEGQRYLRSRRQGARGPSVASAALAKTSASSSQPPLQTILDQPQEHRQEDCTHEIPQSAGRPGPGGNLRQFG